VNTENPARPIRVVVVDDHRTVLWGLERLVDSARPRIELAGSATDIDGMLEVASGADPDIVLLDLDLGGRDSSEAIPRLAMACRAKVLILTGNRDPAAHAKAIVRGARGVLKKDESADVILQAIERVHAGEAWINREMVGRLIDSLSQAGEATRGDPARDPLAALTPRERQIVESVVRQRGAKGISIAGTLGISENTLRNHLSLIYDKLGVRNRLDLYAYALERGLGAGT
jgi:two-component system, NarL family, nitrate/nitrite response regulator NarL